ncbi:acetate--CoA ligase family protein [Marinobacter sp. M3C]|uniref:acetate--CoA ligase family protein n=1 Tax=unclassified Marinobacter TaxID=83889 RepID=UPI00200D168E|nr:MULTISPECIES: acetate--CoA ligase [unclassified Marinobacter]UQG57225.1 acetate--CoA ligase family protein [Marinobacter sp. M4C]UQG61592.1 acetate--CoA ligase family protein [Marinobacter sp. M3C]UQG66029.1 acetate--CoA ligase family protein [Marinobacter sp. M2C]UQG70309.1 acetate--CoA ligase family protein [Marinobacter sp. M1C]
MKSSLHDFLAPDSIAILGASSDPTKRGYKAMVGLVNDGYEGAIYPINPKADTILGYKAYPSMESLPGPAALALICTPAKTIPDLLGQCGRNGTKGVIILASGFGEVDEAGAKLGQEVLEAAQKANVRIVGPNTSGVFNLHKKVNLLALDNVKPGDIGIISQSGNMLLALALEAQSNGHVGFSTYVGPGNQIDLGFADYLQYLGEDENTRVATLYVEGFKDGRLFLNVAKEIAKTKPVVVYKSGSTEAGQKAAKSHTGALAGSYAMTVDLLRQVGVTVVSQSDEILPVAEGLGLLQQANGNRVAILADGGGQATIASDRLSEAGLELAELSDATRSALRDILFPQASLVNPVDVAGSTDANPALLADCMSILVKDTNVDMVFLVGMFGGYGIRFAEELKAEELQTADAIAGLSGQTDKPLVVYSLYSHVRPEPLVRLREAGVPVYNSIEHAVQVLKALSERGAYISRTERAERAHPLSPNADVVATFKQAQKSGRDLFEFEAKSLLRAYGVDVPKEWIVRNEAEFLKAVAEFGHTSLAMKVVSKDILHKSDAGGVKLNLSGEADLRRGHAEILASCKLYKPDAEIEGVLLAPMARKGTEVIIGVSRDPMFGPVLMFGLGGIFVEVLEDVAFRAIPLSRDDARSMVGQIKARKILEGARGEPAVSKDALVELLLKVSSIVDAHSEILELDLNPVIAYNDGYAVVDARVIVRQEAPL